MRLPSRFFRMEELMNDELQQAFYSVMYKYKLPFTEQGVRANLEQWQTAKAGLLELLRRHPNWREEELAIVFDISEQREIDHDRVDEAKFELALLAEEMQMPQDKRDCFTRALDAATADYATVPSDARVSEVSRIGGIKCGSGMKASRIINRLSLHFGLDTFETEKLCGAPGHQELRRVHPYQAAFARLADALNPVTLTKRGVLSVHPCDFLEMSNKDNSRRDLQ